MQVSDTYEIAYPIPIFGEPAWDGLKLLGVGMFGIQHIRNPAVKSIVVSYVSQREFAVLEFPKHNSNNNTGNK